jgi:TPR repeat protein
MPLADLEDRARSGDVRAQVALAERLDVQGRHEDAINWLSRAAGSGDAGALAILGLRLLEGRNAPLMPREGAGLLSDAAARGSGEAAAVISALAGGGFHGPQSWSVALDYLQRAAELGWRGAQAQLELLAPGGTWGERRAAVDLAAWTCAPAVRGIIEAPRVFAADALAPPEVCDFLIGQSRSRLVRAEVHDPRTGLTVMGSTRTNRVANFSLTETTLLNLLIQAKISAATGIPMSMMEAFAILHYGVGEEASEHFDYLDPSVPAYAGEIAELGQRVATCLLYLNDDYEGGETDFPRLGLSHRGRKGDALIFFSADRAGVPDPRTVHAGRPPTRGEKWVLSQFIRDKDLAPGRGPAR